jgi:hypothetical protein
MVPTRTEVSTPFPVGRSTTTLACGLIIHCTVRLLHDFSEMRATDGPDNG